MASKRLNGFYTYTPTEGGMGQTFGPGDELPDWAAEQAKPEHYADPEGDDAADLPAAGPGQVAGEGLSEDEKAEARKKNDRERKAAARAAAKKQADDEAAVQAAAEAEAARKAEAEAEALKLAQPGGGS